MSEDCLFCGIVSGEIPSRTVYEDEASQAFLDVNPLARGHTVVIPKDHHERVGELPEGLAGDLFRAINELTPAVERAVDAPATTVGFNNGEAAGQEIPHVHCHIVPRTPGDGSGPIHAMFGGVDLTDGEMDEIASSVREERA